MVHIKDDSLETLRRRIDLVEVLGSHIELKRTGSSYKALCPFHDEKTPSFVVQRGGSHYHCFGCGAHGDAIEFLMSHQNMSFVEAVESLAEKFHVPLDYDTTSQKERGPPKKLLYEVLGESVDYYHQILLKVEEPLLYLRERGITEDFIRRFKIGYAPKNQHAFFQKIDPEILRLVGLARRSGGPFFEERILFPIHHPSGKVIGFSGRKWKEETFGGKYINTPETPLFKKSKILFGLNECRRRIAKERRAIIVEGQVDALRLIYSGLTMAIAGQGTAFGEGQVQELTHLGVNQVYLALDSDTAGRQAAVKIGNLFQKAGVEVWVAVLPQGQDPDSLVQKEGIQPFVNLLKDGIDYLSFLVNFHSKEYNTSSPAGKKELVSTISKQIRTWEDDVMVHESLKKLAHLTQVPEQLIGIGKTLTPSQYIQRFGVAGIESVDPNRVLETDCLRWLISSEDSRFLRIAKLNLTKEAFIDPACRLIFEVILSSEQQLDRLQLMSKIQHPNVQKILEALFKKKIQKDKAEVKFLETVQKILERNWLAARERAHQQITQGTEEEQLHWLQHFNDLSKNVPKLILE